MNIIGRNKVLNYNTCKYNKLHEHLIYSTLSSNKNSECCSSKYFNVTESN